MMVDRVMHGFTIEDAKAGLQDLNKKEELLSQNQPKRSKYLKK